MQGGQPESDRIIHKPDSTFIESTNVWNFMESYDIGGYDELIERTTEGNGCNSRSGVEWFWDEIIDYLEIEFYDNYEAVRDNSDGPQFTNWYPGGRLNIAHNVVDRHADVDSGCRNAIATMWEGEDGMVRKMTFNDLRRQSNQVANFLDEKGIECGDTVTLYMPMVPEVVPILYGCFKVGAIAVPIFSGFGVDAVATRLDDAESSVLFTADGFLRRGEPVYLKETVDEAIQQADTVVETVIVFERLGISGTELDHNIPLVDERDFWWRVAVETANDNYDTTSLPSDQESLLLYSSGTTGKPKGIVHTHAGVQVQCAKEVYFGFDLKANDRFFWVSDIGWMMGPWSLIGTHTFGGTLFMYEGAPDYPKPDRLWQMIDRHGLTQFGISPTAIRALRKYGDHWIEAHDLSSLRLLGSTGEPWDSETWLWFYEMVGNSHAPIINISGGTEICGCFLMPMPIQPLKPCTLGGPGLGMAVDIVDQDGKSVADAAEQGFLVARDSCPSMTKSLWSGDERYLAEYWSTWKNIWDHGDWAQQDEDGFWFLHGRADDALNIAGRKVGPGEVEGAALEHPAVNQAAAIGAPDGTTGSAVVVYVIVDGDYDEHNALREGVRKVIGRKLGKPFRPREILFVDELPKTQSGKIIRRAVEATYRGEDVGDLSSIDNPISIEKIKDTR